MSVSTVATMLSAYYIFVWNPHAGNFTQAPNAERIVMALQRASGDYAFANAADHEYTGKIYVKPIIKKKIQAHTHIHTLIILNTINSEYCTIITFLLV